MSYRYYQGAPGRRYCWAVDPTFICPNGALKYSSADEEWEVPEPFMRAAEILDVFPSSLVKMVVRGHRNNRRLRENGRLTDRCETCGTRMKREGFRAWIEQDKRPEDLGTSDQITLRLGGSPSHIVKTIYFDTKKEAVAWALDESRISKAIAKEPSIDGK